MNILFNKYVVMFARILFGLNFLINGLNPFLNFYQLPTPSSEASALADALVNSGYLFLVVKIVEIIVGLLLLINRFVPLALIVIFPISLNIFMFDTILEPTAAPIGILVLALNIYLCFAYIRFYRPFLVQKATL